MPSLFDIPTEIVVRGTGGTNGVTFDRPIGGYYYGADTFANDLEDLDRRELFQDIQEGLFSGVTDSAGTVLKAIVDSIIASQNQAGTAAGNFPTTEATIEALNNANDPTAGLINLTVGSNQMLSDADMTAAQEAAAASTDPLGGSTSSLEPDADLMGTDTSIFDSTASAASTAGSGATVVNTDAEHPWLYEGNGVLRNVFTGEVRTNESGTENLVVGETYSSGTPTEATTRSEDTTDSGNINITLTPSVGGGTTSTVVNTPTNGTADTAVVDGGGGLDTGGGTITNGNGVETTTGNATITNTDPTLTVGTPTVTPSVTPTPTVINGTDGVDGQDGRDGRDGRDGLTGLLTLNSIATPLADEIFTSEFKMDYLKPEFIGLLDLRRGRTV